MVEIWGAMAKEEHSVSASAQLASLLEVHPSQAASFRRLCTSDPVH
jgi:hypothetical protein